MSAAALVLCGGSGTRMGPIGINKTLLELDGKPVFLHSALLFHSLGCTVVIVAPRREIPVFRGLTDRWGLPCILTAGGEDRFGSVLRGLKACPPDTDTVLVHDGARPLIREELILRVMDTAREKGSAVPALPVTDTLKAAEDGLILKTVPRDGLWRVQTPQGFSFPLLCQAYAAREHDHGGCTDDASVLEAAGQDVYLVPGEITNIKLTTQEDLALLRQLTEPMQTCGFGVDAHRLVPGRALVLCGVTVPCERGLEGHSDADVAVHALIDALLGACAMGDIGQLFPDRDPRYKDISSLILLEKTLEKLREEHFFPCHADITILCQAPRLSPFIPRMRETLARVLGLPLSHVSVKATTTEKMGYEGRGEGITAMCSAAVRQLPGPFINDSKEE